MRRNPKLLLHSLWHLIGALDFRRKLMLHLVIVVFPILFSVALTVCQAHRSWGYPWDINICIVSWKRRWFPYHKAISSWYSSEERILCGCCRVRMRRSVPAHYPSVRKRDILFVFWLLEQRLRWTISNRFPRPSRLSLDWNKELASVGL